MCVYIFLNVVINKLTDEVYSAVNITLTITFSCLATAGRYQPWSTAHTLQASTVLAGKSSLSRTL